MPEGAETVGTIPSTNQPSRQAKRYKFRTVGKDIGKKLREHDTLVEQLAHYTEIAERQVRYIEEMERKTRESSERVDATLAGLESRSSKNLHNSRNSMRKRKEVRMGTSRTGKKREGSHLEEEWVKEDLPDMDRDW